MDLKIPALSPAQLGAQLGKISGAASPVAAGGFGQALQSALQSVSATQNQSSELQRQVQLENPPVLRHSDIVIEARLEESDSRESLHLRQHTHTTRPI